MTETILALDFGGTKLSAAVVRGAGGQFRGTPLWQHHGRVFSPAGADATSDLEMMLALARELLSGGQPATVGVSFGGPVDFDRGVVRLSHHVPGWEQIPLRAHLEAAFGAPAVVDNDANAAALGEWRYGAGQGTESLLYVTVSTGVGGGWVLEGRLWRGAGGMAGEIGHTVVEPAGPRCLCGKRGCVERLASGPYMAADVREALLSGSREAGQLLELLDGDLEAITGQVVARAAVAGDLLAQAILVRGARALGVGLGNAANLIEPQRIVLGGGVTKAGALWWDTVRTAADETALPEVSLQIVPAALGDDAPLWGAVALATDRL